ncbi:pentatricopeptide repeat-containing protein At4g04790, mitochondrial-like isoform X1 [Salvia splendens]|uniref:pentatricopeptide repeat-containing protein At4g04790, mitochondrial-like isoform X1 n=1 Tax=Salvia splendens TaxID=180675 RepID=UPI001C27B83D|nr:pentatricopeptide repeat-containing protein At4g04790, mitochondrial-like isoform X1 [Salvia splendens]
MNGTLQRTQSTAQNLASLFRSAAATLTFRRAKTSAARRKGRALLNSPSNTSSPSSSDDVRLKGYISSVKPPSPAAYLNTKRESNQLLLLSNFKAPLSASPVPNSSLGSIVCGSLTSDCVDKDDESADQLASHASSVLYDEMDLNWDDDEDQEYLQVKSVMVMPWLETLSNNWASEWRKEISHVKKQKWVFKDGQDPGYKRLVKMCATKLGSDQTVALFGKLGRENGLDEFNMLIKICIEKARDTTDEDVSLREIYKAYQLFLRVRESGFQIEEKTYGQFLMYLIDFEMSDEFFFFHELIREDNPNSLPRLTYYEMLLRVRVDDVDTLQQLCLSIATERDENYYRREGLLLALYESDRKEEFLMLLETLDISKVTSVAVLECIFRGLGKFLLEHFAERFLSVLKGSDIGAENISNFILEYAISMPNLAVEGIIRKFRALHTKIEVLPTSVQYEKLIAYSCKFFKIHEALDVVDEALGSGVSLSLDTIHSILDACDRSCEFNLVHQIYSRISNHNLERNNETFRRMILLCVKMKDFEGAYGLIDDWKKESTPTTGMYNVILAGYFREKNVQSAHNVLKQMEDAGVKPDAITYSYLIANTQREKDIAKYYDEMSKSGITPTKQVFMALINAYASYGNFEYAREVASSYNLPAKYLKEINSVLVGALASNGKLSDALELYEKMKGDNCDLDPRAIKCLIEHYQSEGQVNKVLELLEELNDSPHWVDACFRVISHCVRQENLRSTVNLLKQLKDKFIDAEVALEVLFDEVFCLYAEHEPTDMQFGLNLLEAVKEKVGVRPSRKSLDFLLSACTNAKDTKSSFLIWKEYKRAGLPYNVLSFVRMYQALLASGDTKSAERLLNKIPQSDAHVRCVIKACQETYGKAEFVRKKGTKKKKATMAKSII